MTLMSLRMFHYAHRINCLSPGPIIPCTKTVTVPVAYSHGTRFIESFGRYWGDVWVLDDNAAGSVQVSVYVHIGSAQVSLHDQLILRLVSASNHCTTRSLTLVGRLVIEMDIDFLNIW